MMMNLQPAPQGWVLTGWGWRAKIVSQVTVLHVHVPNTPQQALLLVPHMS